MGCIHSKPSSSKDSSSKRPFRSSNFDANGEQEAHEAALSQFQVFLGSRRQQEYKKLIAQDQRRSAATSGSKVNRTQVIDGRIWFFSVFRVAEREEERYACLLQCLEQSFM